MLWQEHLCNYIRRFGYCGAFRFRLLNFFYRLSPLHSRSAEYDFILPYLDPVKDKYKIRVIDVGASHSLFVYELLARGYVVCGTDQRPYQEKLRKDIGYIWGDISFFPSEVKFDFVTCISVIEHVGKNEYGDNLDGRGDYNMIKKIAGMLNPGGIFLLTCPTKEWTGRGIIPNQEKTICRGYSYLDLEGLTKDFFKIIRHEVRIGQNCLALVRK